MRIPTAQIKELREETGAGFLNCRQALEASNGDLEQAIAYLKEKGLDSAAIRVGRETNVGVLDLYSHGDGRIGVMVEVNCETDFVARTEEFRKFAHEIALQIAANSPQYVDKDDVPQERIAEEKELARNWALQEGTPEKAIDKIVEDRIQKFYKEKCLLVQPYIRDDSKTVDQLKKELVGTVGENITIRRFMRWGVGEYSD